ncbi:thioesterase family protein [Paracoccus sp. S1E-3]|uniref:acyl-CoA thioesterase n=1 Tax=Paracoccus sp. S1E-3 TaxID=2756130 RepID=UPI0015EEED68|nr:thioesterase family protein [Paracoccus sp. S1E-3]MBA4491071.1 acyl-CoA thioesterase [Paracoccus sp. S1E-3]
MHFRFPQKILFKHCDPAGIVFYPRYFEIINDAVEAMFSDLIGWPFEEMHNGSGVPTATISVDFTAPSRHGDQIALEITIARLGRSSMVLKTVAMADEETRFIADHVLVCVNEEGRPRSWPDAVRKKVNAIMEGSV